MGNEIMVSSNHSPLKTHLLGAAILLVALAVFYLSPNVQVFDSNYSMLFSEVMLRGHTVNLGGVPLKAPQFDPHNLRDGYPYHFILKKGRLLYYMPWGGSILALPAVAALNALGISALTPDGHFDLAGECAIQKILAALLMGFLTWLIFYSALLVELPLSWAAVIALGAAFGTQVWSTASRGLWEQTWLLVLLGMAMCMLLRWKIGRGHFRSITFGTLMSWMYFVRPMASIPILAISAYVLLTYPRRFPAYLLTGLLWLGAFVACSMHYFGAPIPPYYHETWWLSIAGARHRLMAVLFSPSRGLFVYVPVFLFVLFLTGRYRGALRHEKFVLMSLGVIVVDVAILSTLLLWWGGWSYGPRELTETIPFFVLLAIMSCKEFLHDTSLSLLSCSAIISLGMATVILSVLMNAPGALSWAAVASWNAQIDRQHQYLLWDWSGAPFLAPLKDAVAESGDEDRTVGAGARLAGRADEHAAVVHAGHAWPVIETVNGIKIIGNYGGTGSDWAPVVIFAKASNRLLSWWDSDVPETVVIAGRGFDTANGVAVGVICPCPGSGQIGPFFFNPGNTNFEASRIILKVPRSLKLPVGSGYIEVRNRGSNGSYSEVSNHVWVSLGMRLQVRHVYQNGTLIRVDGSGFEAWTRINLYNSKAPFYAANPPVNLGGVDANGKPRIPLKLQSDVRFTFSMPDGATPGEWYVEVINPPYLPFASSYTDPGGAFVLR